MQSMAITSWGAIRVEFALPGVFRLSIEIALSPHEWGLCAMRTSERLVLSDGRGAPFPQWVLRSLCLGAKMRPLLGTFLAALLVSIPRASLAQSSAIFQLLDVSVVGSKRYKAADIAGATGLKVAGAVSLDALKEAADRLSSTGLFSQVTYKYQTHHNTVAVVFTVEDAAQLLPCSFENFVWFSRDELLQGLRSQVPLFDGSVPPGGKMLELISTQLSSMLESRGIHAQVQFEAQGPVGGPVQSMQFREVGVPTPITKIEFTGVQKVDAALLEDAARSLLDKDYDASFTHDFARRGIGAVYRQRGYLRAEFGAPVPHLLAGSPTSNSVVVTIPVSEGEQYRLSEVVWSGESAIPYSELAKSLHVAIGSPLDAVQLEQDVLSLIRLFHPKGYLRADAKSNAVLDDATHSAACQIQIRQGDLFRLGRFEIAGLDEGHARSLEKLSQLRPGDPYDATYWTRFLQGVSRQLPPSQSGWKLRPEQTIHDDTKTVDVRLNFSPVLSH